jgi:hypothetical protein
VEYLGDPADQLVSKAAVDRNNVAAIASSGLQPGGIGVAGCAEGGGGTSAEASPAGAFAAISAAAELAPTLNTDRLTASEGAAGRSWPHQQWTIATVRCHEIQLCAFTQRTVGDVTRPTIARAIGEALTVLLNGSPRAYEWPQLTGLKGFQLCKFGSRC